MVRHLAIAALAAATGLFAAPPAAVAGTTSYASVEGVWRNPKNTVHVEIRPCGASSCGYVVWASPKAQADARKGGAQNLVGMLLLRNFHQVKDRVWRGKVFVPDLNMTLSGSAELMDPTTLKAKGCLIAAIACKSQKWTRIG